MSQEFLFHLAPVDHAALLPQVSRALEKRTEQNSRRECPRMWSFTDRLNARNEAVSKRPGAVQLLLYAVLTLAGLLLFTAFLLDPAEFRLPGLFGAAACLWGLFRMYHIRRWSVLPILVLHGILTAVSGFSLTRSGGSGKWLLYVGVSELVAFLILLLPRRPKKATPFERAASTLLEHRGALSSDKDVTIRFGPDGMEVSGTSPVPYSRFEGIFETEEILLCIVDETAMLLQKSELVSGTLEELQAFLSERTSLIEA